MVEQREMMNKLKEALGNNSVIMGTKETTKNLKLKKVKLVIIANNVQDSVRKDIVKYSELSETKIEDFDGTAKELGIMCGKPFPVAVLSIK
ncbi:MAG: 50S ribosomal protein L30e [Nanoarchaeota archaeon]|nr:50S ribosomal protein L30e [Nanoarchaeota archaeon]